METQQAQLMPPRRKKQEKRPNICAGPAADEPPGIAVHFRDDILRLSLPSDEPDVLVDDRGLPDRQVDYDHLKEHTDDKQIIHKTHGETFPKEVDQNFDTHFDDVLHGNYLREHLKTVHLSSEIAQKLIEMIKTTGACLTPPG